MPSFALPGPTIGDESPLAVNDQGGGLTSLGKDLSTRTVWWDARMAVSIPAATIFVPLSEWVYLLNRCVQDLVSSRVFRLGRPGKRIGAL